MPQFHHLILFGSFLAGLGCTAGLLPFWKVLCNRLGCVDDPGERKIHQHRMPLAGGLAIFAGIVIPILFALAALYGGEIIDQSHLLVYGFKRRGWELGAILLGSALMLATGLADDRFELRPGVKFLLQLASALIVCSAGVRITLFVHNIPVNYLITVLWILTIVNAVNFLDNMNGLCGGIGFIAILVFGLKGAANGQYLVAGFCLLIAGSLLGFLFYNFPKASTFLGDSGSHLVGFLMAVLAILPDFYNKTHMDKWAVLAPLVILFVPLFDIVSVVIIRHRLGRPFYVGDNNHISHRLVRAGLSKTNAVLLLWLVSALCGFLGSRL